MSATTLHILVVDLPIALVILGPILFVAGMFGKDAYRVLTVPAVTLSILGASILGTFYFHTCTTVGPIIRGNSAGEVLGHLDELSHIAARTFLSIAFLFASALLLCQAGVQKLSTAALRVTSILFSVGYALGCVWLFVVAHHGAQLADHLASDVRP